MKLADLAEKRILILGYGKEGKATETFLKTRVPSAHITIADQSTDPDYLNRQYDHDIVIKSPGIPKRLLKVPYTTATNIFFANVRAVTIGVTGTKGKSTTASLIHAILMEAGLPSRLAGNIGVPLLGELLTDPPRDTIFVCELSSYQLEDLQYSPHISVVINLFPEHMDHHGSEVAYYEAKHQIIANATSRDYFIYNPEFPELRRWAESAIAKALPFVNDVPVTPDEVSLKGRHNRDDMRAAVTAAGLLGVPGSAIKAALKTFVPLPHRMQYVGTYRDIAFFDDAISTTPESTIKAIETLQSIGTIFLGGQNRGYRFDKMAETIADYQIANVVLFPDSGQQILKSLESKVRPLPRILTTDSMDEAVRFAYDHTPPGSICLLSTASPSYSLWKNFEEKGDEFRRCAERYGNS